MGSTVTVSGFIVEGPHKGYKGGLNMVVQIINDSSIQELIQIPVSLYFGESGTGLHPELKKGSTYRLRVYETGEYVGTPGDAYKESGIISQTTGFYFQNRLVVISGKKIDPIEWSPISFQGRNALLSGTAKNENDTAVIQSSKWKLKLVGFRKWATDEVGNLVEVYGKVEQTEAKGTYNIKNGEPHLVKLDDQLGKKVSLRGSACNLNQYWWFNYRGTKIYVEKIEALPNWTGSNHLRPIEITGILEQAEMPDLDRVGIETNPGRKLYYIVRKASWTPVKELLTPELWFEEEN